MQDPEKWLAQYDEKLKALAAQAEQTDKALREVGGVATSPDGEITVRVSASGALEGLVIRPEAGDLEPERLAAMIMEASRQAQRDAGAQVVEAMRGLVGEDSEAMEAVKANLPQGYTGDGEDQVNPDLVPDTRPDDEYFENPPEVVQ